MNKPKKNFNSVFKDAEDWRNNAIIRQDPLNGWIAYIEGYRIAAEKLIDEVLSIQDNRDPLIYPIVFFYRHYIEIQLKEIIQTGSKEKGCTNGHDLNSLWSKAKIIINEIWVTDTDNVMNQKEEIINSINEIDKTSDSFRYPFDTK